MIEKEEEDNQVSSKLLNCQIREFNDYFHQVCIKTHIKEKKKKN